ncbi:hypothetical protein JH06_2938 [Blastocystis sp. subtype 4]|uniref:hypothetical protein n=1 Tax=Blastocystis sp. subtype 4 TaxID=944170 RepID=UPI00071215CD|nr:hypothetical protein JH06_2938 [Blastocystis sp. subtype 4]KNB43279.1 hypothetical protein JH06_2938 [Blastocystis sp. subtype 4]|eukprot:XP_014526722.1 hypothetical protein JH06_2938 [Blastocystis sp. subtype 4]
MSETQQEFESFINNVTIAIQKVRKETDGVFTMTRDWVYSKLQGIDGLSHFVSNASFWFQTIVWVILIYLLTAVPGVETLLVIEYS